LLAKLVHTIDYVTPHELWHMVHKKRLKEYWNLLKTMMLDYEKRKEWLRWMGRYWIP